MDKVSHSTCVDIPGTDYRVATIAGPPESCHRAKKMVEDIVAEVSAYSKSYSMQFQYVLTLSTLHHLHISDEQYLFLSTNLSISNIIANIALPWGWTLHVELMNGGSK